MIRRILLRFWRCHIVGDGCSRCDVQVATRYAVWRASNLPYLPGTDVPTRGWLCVACARAVGVEAPEKDDR